MTEKKIILSIDWDHTLRHLQGLDIQILTLIIYCQGKGIPVGLTTHRDRENFILYSLYYWQHQSPKHKTDALSAAIDYWQRTWFEPMGIKFDFINARYQPEYDTQNYYDEVLQPLERLLSEDINASDFLWDKEAVKERIASYTKEKESPIPNNEYKQAQINWLARQYDPLEIWHIDDCHEVSTNLPLSKQENVTVKSLHYASFPLFSNKESAELVEVLGLLDDARLLLANGIEITSEAEGLSVIAIILFIIHCKSMDQSLKDKLEQILESINHFPALKNLVSYTQSCLNCMDICLLPNRC